MGTETAVQIPGYIAGTWSIDVAHTDVSFTVRHMMVSKVRGHFTKFEGQIVTGESFEQSKATATIDLSSIATNNEQRDAHIRSADFFEVEKFPTMTYESTSIRQAGDHFVMEGNLTLKGVTKPVALDLEVNGFWKDPNMGTRVGFTATGKINRFDFNVNFNAPLEGSGVVVGDEVTLLLEVEAVLNQ